MNSVAFFLEWKYTYIYITPFVIRLFMDDVIAKDLHYIKCISKHKYTLLSEVFFYAQHLFLFLLSMNKLTISQIYFQDGEITSVKTFLLNTYLFGGLYTLFSLVQSQKFPPMDNNNKLKMQM